MILLHLNEPLTTKEGFLNPACMNELEATLTNMPKTHERLKNDTEWTKKNWLFIHDITGYLAMWAIRQSPYAYPEGLDKVIKYLDACLNTEIKKMKDDNKIILDKMFKLSLCEINKMLYDILYEQGMKAFDNWNKCKKGNTPDISFTSRYDNQKNPDYDFIDLDALLHNVCISIRDERRKNDDFDRRYKEEYGSLSWEK